MVKFKFFVTEIFKKVVEEKLAFKDFEEGHYLSLYRFNKKYKEELKIFSDRWNEIVKEKDEEVKKEGADVAEIEAKFLKRAEDLLDQVSELDKIDYNCIKKAGLSPYDLEVLEPVLKNIPE